MTDGGAWVILYVTVALAFAVLIALTIAVVF